MLCKVAVILVVLCASAQAHDELLARTIGSLRERRNIAIVNPDCKCNHSSVVEFGKVYSRCLQAYFDALNKEKRDAQVSYLLNLVGECKNRIQGLKNRHDDCEIAYEEFYTTRNLARFWYAENFSKEYRDRVKKGVGENCDRYLETREQFYNKFDECYPSHGCQCSTLHVKNSVTAFKKCKDATKEALMKAQGSHTHSATVQEIRVCLKILYDDIEKLSSYRNRYDCAKGVQHYIKKFKSCKEKFNGLDETTKKDTIKGIDKACEEFLNLQNPNGKNLAEECKRLIERQGNEIAEPEAAEISQFYLAEAL